MKKFFGSLKPAYYYIIVIVLILCAGSAYIFTGTAYTDKRNVNDNATRDGLMWEDAPQSMEEKWTLNGAKKLIDTPGASIVSFDNEIRRVDSETGKTVWNYTTKGSICDTTSFNNNVATIIDNGHGCNDIITFKAESGSIIHTAKYATPHHEAKLRADAEKLAVVTPSSVRILRDDLVTTSEFGDQVSPLYSDDQHYDKCEISDVVISAEKYAVAAKCFNTALNQQENTFNIKVNKLNPEESSRAEEVLNIDTGSAQPVTLPIMTRAMIQFITSDNQTSAYNWEVTKNQSLVSREFLNFGEYGFPYQDFEGIGYLWRTGTTLNLRHGSEDLTNPIQVGDVIGNVMIADTTMLVPMKNSVRVWNPINKVDKIINVPGLDGRQFAFSGRTVMSMDENGVVRGYSSNSIN